MAKDKIDEEFLVRELQNLRNKIVNDFMIIESHKVDCSGNITGAKIIKLSEARTDRLLALQAAIRRLDVIIPAIKEGIKTGEAWLYLRTMLTTTEEFKESLQGGKNV